MAPQRCSKPRRTTSKEPAQHEGSEDERASQQDSQSSGDDNKVMRIAEKMRKDVFHSLDVFPEIGLS